LVAGLLGSLSDDEQHQLLRLLGRVDHALERA
jgi:hypothetical protein